MKRCFCLVLALCLLLSGATTVFAEETVTVKDHADREVTLPRDIQRIVVCDILPLPSVLSVFFDGAEKIVGMAKASMTAAQSSLLSQLYPEILSAQTSFINGSDVNLEELMKLKPDVVFYSASSTELGEKLRAAGFAAVAISVNKWNYDCIETLNQWLALLGQMFPENDVGDTVRAYSEAAYQEVQARVLQLTDEERARAFFLFKYSDTAIVTSGERFFGQWWADAIGAINVAKELEGDNARPVNLEQIYAWNPNRIFITNFTPAQSEDLYQNTVGNYDWSGIDAVEAKRVYKMPLGMYRSYTPGVDTPITLLWMAKTAYPELFADIDVTARAREYYQSVFGVALTDEQVQSIFAPAAEAGDGFSKE